MSGEKSALEQEKSGIREELVRVEQEKMDLDTEKHGELDVWEGKRKEAKSVRF